ncbi:hypothetical protein Scep_023937 [Stephania cephalantha]|uniref:Uncharacterized protein n=1 Tax=Stephania cephalantha TaxID=152367 RepID=A0AAP0EYH9_9MAGN
MRNRRMHQIHASDNAQPGPSILLEIRQAPSPMSSHESPVRLFFLPAAVDSPRDCC